ncbi:MAG: DUF3604 domain-containing protein [Halieaceae bacterium]|nr:DUF3604 domain-containing protein [Halieaceae bacterium]
MWTDAGFDPAISAFYYVRVLQILFSPLQPAVIFSNSGSTFFCG